MQVKNRLTGPRSDIEHRPVPVFNAALARNVRSHKITAADGFRVFGLSFFQSADMLLGNDQHVRRRLRVDVLKRVGVFILVNFLRGNFTGDNPAEQTVSHDTP